jgi:hypothetical protein
VVPSPGVRGAATGCPRRRRRPRRWRTCRGRTGGWRPRRGRSRPARRAAPRRRRIRRSAPPRPAAGDARRVRPATTSPRPPRRRARRRAPELRRSRRAAALARASWPAPSPHRRVSFRCALSFPRRGLSFRAPRTELSCAEDSDSSVCGLRPARMLAPFPPDAGARSNARSITQPAASLARTRAAWIAGSTSATLPATSSSVGVPRLAPHHTCHSSRPVSSTFDSSMMTMLVCPDATASARCLPVVMCTGPPTGCRTIRCRAASSWGALIPGNHLELDAQRGRQRRHDPHDRVVQGRVPPTPGMPPTRPARATRRRRRRSAPRATSSRRRGNRPDRLGRARDRAPRRPRGQTAPRRLAGSREGRRHPTSGLRSRSRTPSARRLPRG